MASYTTAEAVRQHVGYRPEFVDDDIQVTAALTAAEALIEDYCGRVFTVDATATTRIYRAGAARFTIDDVSDTSTATVEHGSDRETWTTTTTDYHFNDDESLAGAPQGDWPATAIEFHDGPPDIWVRISAKHGWAAVPDAVAHATKLVAAQLLARRHSPNGIEAYGEFGPIRASRYMDGHAELLLRPYRRAEAFAGIA